ncbi:hypothetical protein PGT21_016254 [Puccinia graminis f. sp. tritici]|uniref:Uncharacterized protein n=1 Tax=Puccinia graminis f. sp. tritici TaxID=56615 RepID=A0A5B0P6Z2_PUCGR|nr:hypothetical protein PGT21_016254 [Puccinia graminis f. sp. tritici]
MSRAVRSCRFADVGEPPERVLDPFAIVTIILNPSRRHNNRSSKKTEGWGRMPSRGLPPPGAMRETFYHSERGELLV